MNYSVPYTIMKTPPFKKLPFTPPLLRPSAPPAASQPVTAAHRYTLLLHQCAADKSLSSTRRIHLHMQQSGFPHLSLGNKLIHAYLKCSSVDDARLLFDEMPQPHIVSWNSIIACYINSGRTLEAISLFRRMPASGVSPDQFTFSSILKVFPNLRLARAAHGRMVVGGIETGNVFTGSALVDMYAKLGRLSEARVVYDRIDEKDVVLATALIVGYTQNGEDSEAIRVFGDMVKSGVRANEYTFASVLRACGNAGELREGMMIHNVIVKTGFESRVDSQTSLLGMYSKCGLIDDSMKVFDQILNPNTVTWTAMIGCLVCSNKEELAFSKFCKMIRDCVDVNEFTLSTVLRGCSSLALFELGKLIHAHALKVGLDKDRYVGAALIDMYGKCAHIGMAKMVFDSLRGLDLVSVNSLIYGYAQNGYGEEAVNLFDLMQNSGLKPNGATFISVLSACSNAGMLEEGRRIFSSMDDYKMVPSNEHYACMVDLLGRAGRLKEAEELINQNSNPDKVLWRALLGACKIHGDVEMGKVAARRILEIDPGDDGTYVLMSNIYASSRQWDEVSSMKSKTRHMKLKKIPAMSWVEVNRETHIFMTGDWSHPQAPEIYKELEGLIRRTKELGYVPDTSFVLQELDAMEKERSLYYHSEKLAIAFGLLSLKSKKNNCIMILKNLRVCGDCHTWIKLVSKVVDKEIIARDAKRFHHFKDGLCSCRDYW